MKNQIKDKISKLTTINGGFENIALLREAYHECNPDRKYSWACNAVQVDGNRVLFGHVRWDFEYDAEDPSDYDWEFGIEDFDGVEEFDLNDDKDIHDVHSILDGWIN